MTAPEREPSMGDVDQVVAANIEAAAEKAYEDFRVKKNALGGPPRPAWHGLFPAVQDQWRTEAAQQLVVLALAAMAYGHRRKRSLSPAVLAEFSALPNDRKVTYLDDAQEAVALVQLYGAHL